MTIERHRGFVLQPTYRIEAGRPVVHLFGVLESGGAFVVRDGRERPHFWVRSTDRERARSLGAAPLADDGRRTMRGEPVLRVEVAVPADAPPLRERLVRADVPCFEADVRFAMRLLIDRGIRGSLSIAGSATRSDRGVRVFDDPELAPADWSPALSVLSFDIETDPNAERLLSIALHGAGASEVHLLTPPGFSVPEGATPHPTERALLEAFCRRVREIDPDVLTGWNVVDFDLRVLDRIGGRAGVELDLGRAPGGVRIRSERAGPSAGQASIPGRVVLDGIDLVRGAFVRVEDHTLDTVARAILGEGKTIGGSGRAEEILAAFHDDREHFVAYNRSDARLALEILERLRLVELAVERSLLTGMPPDRVAASIASFDFLYLSELGRRGFVAPSVGARAVNEPTGGGHVLEPRPGLHRNVLAFDFRSLYPSLIRTFQIDPLGFLGREGDPRVRTEPDPIVAPNGAAFRREPGILPGMLDDLFPKRAAARARGDEIAAQAIKILMNSFYGVLGTPACRFYDPAVANAITSFGREILLWSKAELERRGHPVLYGDTDSLFVSTGESDPERARALGAGLAGELDRALASHVRKRWRVESRLELQLERLYLRLFLPHMRGAEGGARKRYAGLVAGPDGSSEVVFTGMEVVRRDWTPLAKTVQREIYERLFRDEPVDELLRDTVRRLRAGELDADLVYRKALRKPLAEYTSTTPPHVAAARKLKQLRGRIVDYVITTGGPEPASEQHHPFDYEHYVQRQIRPVAEPVVEILGEDFSRLLGDDPQLALF